MEINGVEAPSINRTLKMYIGAAQKRPDAPYARPVMNPSGKIVSQVSEGNRKDIREAVEAAHRAAPGWGKRAAHNRAQIVYYIAENLELRHYEVAQRIANMTVVMLRTAGERWTFPFRGCSTGGRMLTSMGDRCRRRLCMGAQCISMSQWVSLE